MGKPLEKEVDENSENIRPCNEECEYYAFLPIAIESGICEYEHDGRIISYGKPCKFALKK